ncbi:hypothetical protein CGC20_37280 [Leishmania donovani]|uniref:Uncharacterized protein n=1 Tax=Leishmania donovani TaxID=5661 RepID=A0A504X747_LEIDO|nr:hypothetical protein CGC20_37280 [Leishmania donovani]
MHLRRKPLALTTPVAVPNFGAGPSASSRLLVGAHKLSGASFAFMRGTEGLKNLLNSPAMMHAAVETYRVPNAADCVSFDSEPALSDAVGRHSNVKCPLWPSETGGDVADGPVAWCVAESRNDRPLQYRTKPKSRRC